MSNVNDNFLPLLLGVGILDYYTKVLLIYAADMRACLLLSRPVPQAVSALIWNFKFRLTLQVNSSLEIHRLVYLGIRAKKTNIYHSWRLVPPTEDMGLN